MQRHDIPEPGEPGGPPGEERLTTENLAGRRAAVYPGESTGDSAEAREPPTASDASDTADLEQENEPEAGKEDQPLLGLRRRRGIAPGGGRSRAPSWMNHATRSNRLMCWSPR